MWHLSMQASDPQVVQRIVKHRYITEANDPLGVMPKYGKIQVVHEVDRTIATARTPDGPHFGVVQGGSEVRRTFRTGDVCVIDADRGVIALVERVDMS